MATKRKKKRSHKAKAHTTKTRRPRRHRRHRKTARRAKARRSSFRRKSAGRIRPVVIVSGGGFRRPAKSKYFTHPTRINPRRRRRHGYRRARMNPFRLPSLKQTFSKNTLLHYVAIGGGIGLGALLSRFLNTGAVPFMAPPAATPAWVATLQKGRIVHGLIHILVGVTIASKSRKPLLKDVGVGLAALGGFDLLMQLLAKAGVKSLPTFSGMNVNLMGMNYDTPRVVRVAGEGYSGDSDEFIDSLDT